MPGSVTARRGPVYSRQLKIVWAIVMALTLATCAVSLHAGMPLAQKHETRHEIDQLEDQWRSAILNSDTKSMDSLLADDYMAITPAGTLRSRDETLKNMSSGNEHFTSLTITDRKVRFYGTTAVVTSLATIQASTSGGQVVGDYRYTHVYVRNAQGQWKIVSSEASHVRNPGPHKRNEFH
jgi:ketosteroid isomerase-like protein